MVLGTQLSTFSDPAVLLTHLAGPLAGLPVAAGAVMLVATASGVGAAMFRRLSTEGLLAVVGPGLAVAVAVYLLWPAGYRPQLLPVDIPTNQLANIDAGVLALAYVVAPWVGVFVTRKLMTRHRRPTPVALMWSQPANAAGAIGAWLVGLALSVPFMRGFGRWAGGRGLHQLAPGLASRWTFDFWLAHEPGHPDLALAVSLLSAAALYALYHRGQARAQEAAPPARGVR